MLGEQDERPPCRSEQAERSIQWLAAQPVLVVFPDVALVGKTYEGRLRRDHRNTPTATARLTSVER